MHTQPCVQLASYLERSPQMWMMLLHLHDNLNADDDDDTQLSSGARGIMSGLRPEFFHSLIYRNFFFRFMVRGTKRKKVLKMTS